MSEAISTEKCTIKNDYKKIINKNKNNKLFNKYDEILVKKYFSNIHDLSETENILNIKTLTLKTNDIKDIVKSFIKHKKIYKTDIYNVLRISNLARLRIKHNINRDNLLEIGNKVAIVSHETSSICIDFELLRILDNFILHIKTANLKNYFNGIRKDIIRKIMRFEYKKIKEERRVNYFYWVNRILEALIQENITISEFIDLNKKIVHLLPNFIDLHWEIVHILSFLCYHPKYCCSFALRSFKRNMIKFVKTKYSSIVIDKNCVTNALFDTLSQQPANKESFYYVFDIIKILSEKSSEDKLFCLTLLEYLIYRDEYQNIFCYRFVREMFLRILEDILKKDDDYKTKEKELNLMFILSENKNFSYFYSEKILSYMHFIIDSSHQQNVNYFYKKIKRYNKYLYSLISEEDYKLKAVTLS